MLIGRGAGPALPRCTGTGDIGKVRYTHVWNVRKRLITVWKRKPQRLLLKFCFGIWSKNTNCQLGGNTRSDGVAPCSCGSTPRGEYGLAVSSGTIGVVASRSP